MELELFIRDGEPTLDKIEGSLLVGYEDPLGTKPNQFLLQNARIRKTHTWKACCITVGFLHEN